MNKKIVGIILAICFTLTLIGCKKRNIMKDYPSLNDKNHIYKEVQIDDVITMLEDKESFYLVMGFPECPWCQALMPVLNEVAKDAAVEVVCVSKKFGIMKKQMVMTYILNLKIIISRRLLI